MDLFERAAEHQHRDPAEFLSAVEVTPAELADGVLR
jgi:hypothetical protein